MSNSRINKFLYILIPCGIFLFVVCSTFYFLDNTSFPVNAVYFSTVVLQFISGVITSVCAIKYTKGAYQLYIGLLLCIWGFISVLVRSVETFSMIQWWPILILVAGIVLFICGYYKYGSIKFGFAIPSITFFGMGFWYSLFSFKVIKVPFYTVAGTLGPIFMICIAVMLVVVFLAQKKHKKLIVIDEETGAFSDEEVIIPKND